MIFANAELNKCTLFRSTSSKEKLSCHAKYDVIEC